MRWAVLDQAIGYVVRHAYARVALKTGPGETVVEVLAAARLVDVPLHHQTVAAGLFEELPQAQKDLADIAQRAQRSALALGAVELASVPLEADLPVPPPRPGLLLLVEEGPARKPALAVSFGGVWRLFPAL